MGAMHASLMALTRPMDMPVWSLSHLLGELGCARAPKALPVAAS